MKAPRLAVLVAAAGCWCGACVSVERPLVEFQQEPEPVDSRRIPPTSTHAEARAELEKAYGYIQGLERKNADLERDKQKYKRERDDARSRLKKYEDD